MTNIKGAVLGLAAILGAAACGRLTPEEASAKLDAAVRQTVEDDDGVHSAVLWVDAPRLGLQRGWAHGTADTARAAAMTVDTPFYSASVGKLFVAATVLALVRAGQLSLDDPMLQWLPSGAAAGLPVLGGDQALAKITVRMLLGHRSGLPDYFSGTSKDGAPRVYDLLAAEPSRAWTRQALLDYTRLHFAPVGAPGELFHYADTNYDLLGMVLEGVAGEPFHAVVRRQVLAPLGLTGTWYHALEPAPPGGLRPADVFIGDVNVNGAAALSADQAGGGLVTTAADLRRLLRGLLSGTPVPLAALAESFTPDAVHSGIDVGLGAWRIRPGGIFFALAGLPELVGHSGATGVWAYHVAELDAVVVGAVSQSSWQERHVEFLLSEVLPVLGRVPNASPGS